MQDTRQQERFVSLHFGHEDELLFTKFSLFGRLDILLKRSREGGIFTAGIFSRWDSDDEKRGARVRSVSFYLLS